MIYKNILETIGKTPVIKLNNIPPKNIELFVKAEYFNPASSIKDRLAKSIILEAENSGLLKPGQTVVEATSGNTGIGLAMVCAARGYPLVITMPDSASIERRKLMRFLGAKVIITPAAEKGTGMYLKAKELAEKNEWFFARQFENEFNAKIHETTTGQEIISDFKDTLDYWITGYGTGGTLVGVSRVLKKNSPHTKIIATEPDVAQLIASKKIQERNEDGSPASSHPDWTPHTIQGWTPDFIPLVLQEAVDNNLIDEMIPISGEEGMKSAHELASKEGIITGISGGATFAVAMMIAKKAKPGSKILCMIPDTGERYLSSPLFENIDSEMNEDEINLLKSTPLFSD